MTDHWDEYCAIVTSQMGQYVSRFATPLSMTTQHGSGTAWGSGTYINTEKSNFTCILTAEHVVSKVPPNGRLAHPPRDGGDYNAALGSPVLAPWPIDAACLPIYPDERYLPSPDRVLSESFIAKGYAPACEELLFWYGFPGYSVDRNDLRLEGNLRKTMFGQLSTPGKPMLSQALKSNSEVLASNFDPNIHVAINYPTEAKRESDGVVVPLPNAAGMSGSALWDTRFVACALEGKPWSPEMAVVCGVVWAVYDNPDVVFATKIEHIRSALSDIFEC